MAVACLAPCRLTIRFLVVVIILLLCCLPTLGQTDITREKIREAWTDRQKRVRSAKFVWDQDEFFTENYFARQKEINEHLKGSRDDSPVPSGDTESKRRNSLMFDGDKLFHQYEHLTGEEKGLKHKSAFNGKASKRLRNGGTRGYPVGTIHTQERNADIVLTEIYPILFAYRALDPKVLRISLDNYQVTAQRAVIDGASCIVVDETPKATRNAFDKLWLDPARGFSLVRYQLMEQGHVKLQIDVSYVPHGEAGWVPCSWEISRFLLTGPLLSSTKGKVTDFAINPSLPPDDFDLEFPPGTRVTDMRTMEDYILREDGSKRVITVGERGATYEQLVNSEPGMALVKKSTLWTLLFWASIILLVLAVGYIVGRRVARWRKAM